MAKTRIWVFDVEHGSMAFVRAPGGARLVIDCGKAATFSPSLYIWNHELSDSQQRANFKIDKFVVTHPHDDHIEDISTFINYLRPRVIMRQRYDWEEVKGASGGDYENLEEWAKFQVSYNTPAPPIDWGGLEIQHFYLSVSEAKLINESKFINNSSIITIIKANGFKVVFPGDIERDGWLELLKRDNFRTALAGTHVFITSHHGHSSGYCSEIYDVMGKPYFNMSAIHHGDEHIEGAYSSPERARGVQYDGQTRYSFTTRRDGSLLLEVDETGAATFGFRKLPPNIRETRRLIW